MTESSGEESSFSSGELKEQVSSAELNFLPDKSREKYLKAYDLFTDWRLSKGAKTCSETVMLSYFIEISKTRQPSTLWSIYSMLKATLKAKRDIHIGTYPKLLAFLKRASEGYKPKKSKVFTANNVEKFLNEAPDSSFLATKVGLIIGVSGGCRTNELLNLRVTDIEKHSEKLMLVTLPNTKTKIDRSFVIRGEYVEIVEKYQALRPANIKTDRFFLKYGNGKCVRQPMGVNKLGEIPRKVASFLKLQDPQLYTGHSLRRTSTTLLHDSGADLTNLKHHAERKSNMVAESYTEDFTERESKVCDGMVETIYLKKPEDPWTRSSTFEESAIESPSVSPTPSSSPTSTIMEPKIELHHETNSKDTEVFLSTQVSNTTITLPDKTLTLNLQNCKNITFNF